MGKSLVRFVSSSEDFDGSNPSPSTLSESTHLQGCVVLHLLSLVLRFFVICNDSFITSSEGYQRRTNVIVRCGQMGKLFVLLVSSSEDFDGSNPSPSTIFSEIRASFLSLGY